MGNCPIPVAEDPGHSTLKPTFDLNNSFEIVLNYATLIKIGFNLLCVVL